MDLEVVLAVLAGVCVAASVVMMILQKRFKSRAPEAASLFGMLYKALLVVAALLVAMIWWDWSRDQTTQATVVSALLIVLGTAGLAIFIKMHGIEGLIGSLAGLGLAFLIFNSMAEKGRGDPVTVMKWIRAVFHTDYQLQKEVLTAWYQGTWWEDEDRQWIHPGTDYNVEVSKVTPTKICRNDQPVTGGWSIHTHGIAVYVHTASYTYPTDPTFTYRRTLYTIKNKGVWEFVSGMPPGVIKCVALLLPPSGPDTATVLVFPSK